MAAGQLCLALLGLAVHASAMEGCAHCEAGSSPGAAVHTVVTSRQPVYTPGQQVYTSSQPVYTSGQQVYTSSQPVYTSGQQVYRTGSQVYSGSSKPVYSGRQPSVDPCNPHPCGPNTDCSINNRGVGVCQCLPGFFPKPDTITGCGLQCTSAAECGKGFSCSNNKCVQARASYTGKGTSQTIHQTKTVVSRNTAAATADPCSLGLCGINADCASVRSRAVCSCPTGYDGNPLTQCNKGECSEDSQCGPVQACVGVHCVDPCAEAYCGAGANCKVVQHRAICSCPLNYVGDPFVSCSPPSPSAAAQVGTGAAYSNACSPSPCGRETNCQVKNSRAICSCIANYIGNPLVACRPECVEDANCASYQACVKNRCQNACISACGENAQCNVVNHRPVCKCPQYYKGSALTRCFPECVNHEDCAADKACIQLQCGDPCAGACGIGANCRVQGHTATCSCPPGFLGHPYDRCTAPEPAAAVASNTAVHGGASGIVCDTCAGTAAQPGSGAGVFVQSAASAGDMCTPNPCGQYADCTPGTDKLGHARPVCTCPKGYLGDPLTACQRGECEEHTNCPATQACYNYICTNPCLSASGGNVCGTNALCRSQGHKAVCYCPPDYTGEPLTECRLKPIASNARSHPFPDIIRSLDDVNKA